MELNATRPADPLRFLGQFVRRADAGDRDDDDDDDDDERVNARENENDARKRRDALV